MSRQRIEKWKRWVSGPIKDEVVSMHARWDTWAQVQKMLAANPTLPDSHWWGFMADTYITTQAVAIRRQLDIHKDAMSLGKVLEEVGADPQIITKTFWAARVDPHDQIQCGLAEEAWTHTFGGSVGSHIDPAIPQHDLEFARKAAEVVLHYVDRHVAHSDRKPLPATELPDVPDLHYAIDVIGETYKKYATLFAALDWLTLTPIAQYDWMAVFREPWMPTGWNG